MSQSFCQNCGSPLSENASFCPNCGTALSKVPEQQPVAPTPAPTPTPEKPACPENHLAKAIIFTLICCWPLGIPAIINAAGVDKAYMVGNYHLAMKKSEEAAKWSRTCLIVGIVFWVIYIIVIIILAVVGEL